MPTLFGRKSTNVTDLRNATPEELKKQFLLSEALRTNPAKGYPEEDLGEGEADPMMLRYKMGLTITQKGMKRSRATYVEPENEKYIRGYRK